MSAVAIAIGGSALVGYMASQNAANAQEDSANQANQTQMNMYNLSRQDQQPWLDSGKSALNQLNQQLPGLTRSFSLADFQNDPGYQFQLQEGQKAIERSAAARGGGIGGSGTMKSLLNYSQGLAAQDYQNAYNRYNQNQTNTFNRLASLAGVGQTAASQNASGALSTGAALGQNITGAGNAAAAGYVGGANAIQNGVNSGVNNWMGQQYLSHLGGTNPYGLTQQPGQAGNYYDPSVFPGGV